jgi:hypothetical protein
MRWPSGPTNGQQRWTRAWITAAVVVAVGLLVGGGYAAGYVARNGGNSVRQGPSETNGNPDALGSSRSGTGKPGAPGTLGSPGAPGNPRSGTPEAPGRPGSPGTSEGPKDGGSHTTDTTDTTDTTGTTDTSDTTGTTQPAPEHKWYLPPAGPTAPSGNQDVAYRALNDALCGSVLDNANRGLFPLNRHGWLLVGNAHACLGNLQSAEEAADQAETRPWLIGGHPETVRQICALDKALLAYLNRPARPCGAQPAPTTTGTTTADTTESTS